VVLSKTETPLANLQQRRKAAATANKTADRALLPQVTLR
jgi:hypothetical protein